MKLIGLMPVRNEDWVLGLSLRVALQWCDAVVVGLHSCTDTSESIVVQIHKENPYRVHLIEIRGSNWDEMKHRDILLRRARAEDATHIGMIDADEVLTANLLTDFLPGVSRMRNYVEALGNGQMLELPGYNLRGSLSRYHSNGIWGNRWFSCAFKDQPEAHWGGDKFHSRNPAGVNWQGWRPIGQGEGGILHAWGASERRLKAKHALYKVTERLRWPDKTTVEIELLYNLWRSERDVKQWRNSPEPTWEYNEASKGLKTPWWESYGWDAKFRFELFAEPWQEAEVRRLVAEHGREKFAGLDLFGVA